MELTKSWKASFLTRTRYTASSVLTTLDGGPAREYTEVPQVERVVAVHLCLQNAATLRGHPRIPSRACKFSSSLVVKAYTVSGQASSTLHAMAILHEGGPNPEVLLRSVLSNRLCPLGYEGQGAGSGQGNIHASGPEGIEPGPSQAPIQNVDPQTHANVSDTKMFVAIYLKDMYFHV